MSSAKRFLSCALFLLGFASAAAAQTPSTATAMPTFDLSAGYQFLHVPDQNFPLGFNIDGARYFTNGLGVVGELGWAHDSDDSFGVDASTNYFNIGVGPRWTGFGRGRMWPYAQVLVGAAIARNSVDVGSGDDISDTDTAFLIQPGVGATFIAGDGWGVFGQVDYRRTFFDEPDNTDSSINNQFRIYVGVRMILD